MSKMKFNYTCYNLLDISYLAAGKHVITVIFILVK
jgi:hypothetical protein